MPPHLLRIPGVKIGGIAAAVPTESVPISAFGEEFGRDYIAKFSAATGIKALRRAAPGQTASDLSFAAAERLLDERKIRRGGVGLLIFASLSPDYRRPATACVLHKRLRLSADCGAFDLGLGCSAYPYALAAAASLLAVSDAPHALVLAGETMTRNINRRDRSTVMLFGDAGSCTLLEKEEGSAIQALLKTDGEGYRDIIVPAGGFRNPETARGDEKCADGAVRSLDRLVMNGMNVFSFSIGDVPGAVKEFYGATGTSADDYDLFALHQSNRQILGQIAEKIGAPAEKIPLCLADYANTSAASIPLALSAALGGNDSPDPLRTLFCGFGVGLSCAAASANLVPREILPPAETDESFKEGEIRALADLEE